MQDTKSSTKPAAPPAARTVQLAVSTVIFSLEGDRLWIPLVKRTRDPWKGRYTLPGGWVCADEALATAAGRTLAETTDLRPGYLEQLYTFGSPERSPTGRVISVVYFALVSEQDAGAAQSASKVNVIWSPVDDRPRLAFDHDEIVDYALFRLRNKTSYANVAVHLLGDTFTMTELRAVYEAILGRRLDPANFRRRVEATGTILATQLVVAGGRHRPPRLYRSAVSRGELVRGPAA